MTVEPILKNPSSSPLLKRGAPENIAIEWLHVVGVGPSMPFGCCQQSLRQP